MLAFASDGTAVGGAIGPTAVTGVYDLKLLPDGNVVVSSVQKRSVSAFTRKGAPVAQTFTDTDPFTSQKLWPSGFSDDGPSQMAVAGDDLWVAGAKEGSTPGLAVYNWKTGAFQKFVPHPGTSPFLFTSIVARPDGSLLASSDESHTICVFDAATYAPKGSNPCAAVGNIASCGGWSSFLALANGTVVGTQRGTGGVIGCPFSFIGTNLEISGSKSPSDAVAVFGMVEGGAEIAAVALSEITNESFLLRIDGATLATQSSDWKLLKNVTGSSMIRTSGVLRLTPSP
ncbi:MAG: hypothetical protein QM765_10185 [Myxococcales bacterium]